MSETYRAMIVSEQDGRFARTIETRPVSDLPPGDLLIRVEYSALNYKDALSATGHRGVTRRYPHTPGIEAAGTVLESTVSRFAVGDAVIVGGSDMGMNTAGGFAERIRIPADWAMPLPAGFNPREAITVGAAGFTAAQCLEQLQHAGVEPSSGPILVTGATGGVGSMAVCLLAQTGYEVVAATGKLDRSDWLRGLGASAVIDRDQVNDTAGRPLLGERWAGVVDTVGGHILSTAVKTTRYGGAVTACGLAQSPQLHLTVYPFILRAVKLIGIDSAQCPASTRLRLWTQLAGPWKPRYVDEIAHEVTLDELDPYIDAILAGKVVGRTIVRIDCSSR